MCCSIYCIYKYGIYIHYDEFVGRGLYPGLAFFNGFDLYEPKLGPHITLYGWGMALFYSLAGFANTPTGSIWIAYLSNVISFIFIFYLFLSKLIKEKSKNKYIINKFIILIIVISLSIFSITPTTESLYRIHADYPAFIFLFLGIYINILFIQNKKFYFLFLGALLLTLSAWSKLPTLTCFFGPILLFITLKQWKNIFYFILFISIASLITFLFCTIKYGFYDTKFILHDHITSAGWSDRNRLFDGRNGKIVFMDYFDAIPLLFRFLVMYLHEFWYLLSGCLFSLFFSFSDHCPKTSRIPLRSFALTYFLVLPPCLSALAHFGGVENSLFFANTLGFLVCIALLTILLQKLRNNLLIYITLSFLAFILLLPNLRQSNSFPSSTAEAPHQQAYNYLMNGNRDVYFGWYPISHLLANSENLSCIEVPTWAGMTKPKEIRFSKNHFPKGSKYLATGHTGYGSTVLEQYLGKLEEVERPSELSGWRLWKILN